MSRRRSRTSSATRTLKSISNERSTRNPWCRLHPGSPPRGPDWLERPTPPLRQPASFLDLQAAIAEERHKPKPCAGPRAAVSEASGHAAGCSRHSSEEALGGGEPGSKQRRLPFPDRVERVRGFLRVDIAERLRWGDEAVLGRDDPGLDVMAVPVGRSLSLHLLCSPTYLGEVPIHVCLTVFGSDIRHQCLRVPIGSLRQVHASGIRVPHRVHLDSSQIGQGVRLGGTK